MWADHAVTRTRVEACRSSGWAVSVRSDARLHHAGVVRAMARSGHGRCGSRPRSARAASRVTALGQRRITQVRLGAGVSSRVVDHKAGGANHWLGSRMRTPRRRLGGWPACDHPAVAGATATWRGASPDPGARGRGCHVVAASAHTASRVGRRAPVSRGRPMGPGARAGGGAARAASRRRRVRRRARGHART
jgi:hypothetical protein